MLAEYLKLHFRQPTTKKERCDFGRLFSNEGLLGSASARITIAYFMRLIGPNTYNDLKAITNIRNKFAHRTSAQDPQRSLTAISFKHNVIADSVKSLKRWKEYEGTPIQPSSLCTCPEIAVRLLATIDVIFVHLTCHVVWLSEKGRQYPHPVP
jgi:hypothetical protein